MLWGKGSLVSSGNECGEVEGTTVPEVERWMGHMETRH